METDITGVDMTGVSASGLSGKPVEPTVVINNREVPVSMAPEVLKQMEHDLKSGYDRKLADERRATSDRLNADKQFYATHPPEAWEQYEPTVDGGRGWIGQGDPPAVQVDVSPTQSKQSTKEKTMPDNTSTQQAPAFDKSELDKLREEQANIRREMYEARVAQSINTRNALAQKYPDADLSAVTAHMKSWDLEHGLQACPDDVVEQFMKQSHDYVAGKVATLSEAKANAIISARTTETTSATPTLSGGSAPLGGKSMTPSLSDPDAFADYIAGKM